MIEWALGACIILPNEITCAGLPINLDDSDEDENIAFQNVNKLSKLLAKIVQWNNAKRMNKNVCKKLLPWDSNEWYLGGGVTWKVST